METGSMVSRLLGHRNSVYGLVYQPGHSGLLATVSFDWMTLLWDPRSGKVEHALEGHRDDIIGVDFSSSGNLLATGSDDATCRIWDARNFERELALLNDHNSEVKRVKFSPYGRGLLTTSGDGTAKLWDTSSLDCFATLEGHDDHVFDGAWSSD